MASQASISPQATWPGERHPSHLDVELANESLEPNFLGNFKRALLSSPAALNNEDLVHVTLENVSNIHSSSDIHFIRMSRWLIIAVALD